MGLRLFENKHPLAAHHYHQLVARFHPQRLPNLPWNHDLVLRGKSRFLHRFTFSHKVKHPSPSGAYFVRSPRLHQYFSPPLNHIPKLYAPTLAPRATSVSKRNPCRRLPAQPSPRKRQNEPNSKSLQPPARQSHPGITVHSGLSATPLKQTQFEPNFGFLPHRNSLSWFLPGVTP